MASFQGDPASALLEVLDPEQNSEFLDHYLDLRVDLSKVLFVCTANQLDTIPGPLLDRMEEIRLSGYIAEEKLAIAKNHLWPKLLDRHGAKASQIRINDAAIRLVIDAYSREAGVGDWRSASVRWCGRPFSKWWKRTRHGSALASERWKKFLVKLASSRSALNEEGWSPGWPGRQWAVRP